MIRHVVFACGVAVAAVVACQVYSPDDLVGGKAGAANGGTGVGATGGDAGLGGTLTSGTGGTFADGGTSMFEAGAGGEDASGGTAGTTGGTSGTGGSSGGAGGAGGKGGTGGTGGGSGTGGAGGTGGATAGTSGGGAGGAGGTGGTAGAGAGGMASGGAGASGAGAGGAGAGGSAGMAGAPAVELPGTPTASSSENTTSQMHPPEHGNDNDPATRWCAANGNTGQYWTLDLGAVHELVRFEVTWEYPSQAAGLPYLYAIGTSDDGATFTTVIDKTTNTDVATTQSSDFPSGTMSRYVRITVTGLPQSTGRPTWASFWEASVFGY